MGNTESSSPLVNYGKITQHELSELVANLNTRCQNCFADSSVKMLFAVKQRDENSLFWKKSVQIRCFTIRGENTFCKSYGLYEFLKFYHSFLQILSAAEVSSTVDLATNNNLMEMSIFQESCSVEGLCVICFETKPDSVLPCAHAYCSKCVDQFRGVQKCCPLCRYRLCASGRDESWVVAEKPNKECINTYLVGTGHCRDDHSSDDS